MYRVYNVETLAKLVETVQFYIAIKHLLNKLFAGQEVAAYKIYSKIQHTHSVQHYVMNSLLYLDTIKKIYWNYNEFITQYTHIHESHKNISKRLFTNISNNPIQNTENYKFC